MSHSARQEHVLEEHLVRDPHLLPGQVAAADGLEENNDVGNFQVPFFLQVGQNASSEKYLALSDSVQVWVQF